MAQRYKVVVKEGTWTNLLDRGCREGQGASRFRGGLRYRVRGSQSPMNLRSPKSEPSKSRPAFTFAPGV